MKSKLLNQRKHARTIVTLIGGDAYDGLLIAFDGVVIQLAQAAMIGNAGTAIERATVDGLLYLPWAQVQYLQSP